MHSTIRTLMEAWVEKKATQLGAPKPTLPRGFGCDGFEERDVDVSYFSISPNLWYASMSQSTAYLEAAITGLIAQQKDHATQGYAITGIILGAIKDKPDEGKIVCTIGYLWKKPPEAQPSKETG